MATYIDTTLPKRTGDIRIDGIMTLPHWDGPLTYSFPNSGSFPYYNYSGETAGLIQATPTQQAAARFGFDGAGGPLAAKGFAIDGFTNLSVEYKGDQPSDVPIAESSTITNGYPAYTYPLSTLMKGGDIWLDLNSYDNSAEAANRPTTGTWEWMSVLHEVGHSVGLRHPHDQHDPEYPPEFDNIQYTVMSYNSHSGQTYNAETYGYAQTFMMFDIAALQRIYGANYSVNSGDTTYSWRPDSGNTVVNGEVAIAPGANKIFMTVWDGGGTDTYDLSAYSANVTINLKPGAASGPTDPQDNQKAQLGDGNTASGTVYNALTYTDPETNLENKDSLIENAVGGSGNDSITGNEASNTLTGNAGNDTLSGEEGDDNLFAGIGDDLLNGGDGDDLVVGDVGNDTLNGGDGNDNLFAGIGNDLLYGGNGNDNLFGDVGNDSLYGDAGNDNLYDLTRTESYYNKSASGTDSFVGGDGNDMVSYEYREKDDIGIGIYVNLTDNVGPEGDTYVSIENVAGTYFNDVLVGDGGNNQLWTMGGDDTIDGRGGDDYIAAGDGNDVLMGEEGNDQLHAHVGDDILKGGNGNDKLFGYEGNDTLYGEAGNDWLEDRGGSFETPTNELYGGDGDDHLKGFYGTYYLYGGSGKDTASYDGVYTPVSANLSDGSNNQGSIYDSIENLEGSYLGDVLTGNGEANELWGLSGDDSIHGYAGDDTLNGGSGNDMIWGDEGTDVLFGESGADKFCFNANSGVDVIRDFEIGVDKITIYGVGQDQLVLGQVDGHATAKWGGSGVAFANLDTINIDSFEFVA